MQLRPIFFLLICALGSQAVGPMRAQNPAGEGPSSDDITIADGLQLPLYGPVWALDSWKGTMELVQLHTVEPVPEPGISFKAHRPVEFKREASRVRLHDGSVQIFLRRPPGQPASASSPFAIARLITVGQNRQITKGAAQDLIREGKGDLPKSGDLIDLDQQRIGITNWYRVHPRAPLTPDEYVIVPLPGSQGTSSDEIYEFAVDPEAPENDKALHSERDRPVE